MLISQTQNNKYDSTYIEYLEEANSERESKIEVTSGRRKEKGGFIV